MKLKNKEIIIFGNTTYDAIMRPYVCILQELKWRLEHALCK